VLYPQARLLSPRVRVFIDWVTRCFEERFGNAHATTSEGAAA